MPNILTRRRESRIFAGMNTAVVRNQALWIALSLLTIHVVLGLVFALSQPCGTDAAATGFPLDDAWIHLVYARSLATTGIPAYNDGQPEAGFTSPLWLILLTVVELLSRLTGILVVACAKALGIVFAWLTSYGLFRVLRNCEVSPRVSFVVAGLSALSPSLAFAQISGMEAPLASALIVWSVVAYQNERWRGLGWTLAGAFLTRPELAILTPIFGIGMLLKSTSLMRAGIIVKVTAPLLTAGLLWSAYCLAVSGLPLPNTFYAKFNADSWSRNLLNVFSGIWAEQPVFVSIGGAIMFVLGAYWLFRLRRDIAAILIGILALFTIAIAVTREMVPECGEFFYWSRYLAPVIPLAMAPVGFGIMGAASLWSNRRRIVELTALAAVAVPMLFVSMPALKRESRQFCWNCQNINEVQVEFGRWINRNTPAGTAVLVNDAGAIRYFGQRRTIDLLALNDHRFLIDRGLHERIVTDPTALNDFMNQESADYLIIFPGWFPDLVNSPEFGRQLSLAKQLRSENYTICRAAQDLMIAFFRNKNATETPIVR